MSVIAGNTPGVHDAATGFTNVVASGRIANVTATFTRPADTTAYAAEDAVNDSTSAPTILTFDNMARVNGGTGAVVQARLSTDQPTNTARFRLYLYTVNTIAMNNDNAAFTDLYADSANLVGYIDFPALDTVGTATAATHAARGQTTPNLFFACAAADDSLYGRLSVLDAFTPASAQLFRIVLTASQD